MIRTYQSNDFESIMAIFDRLCPHYFHIEEKGDLQNYLNSEIEDYFVWEEQGAILAAGGINYFPEAKEARISWDLVHPDSHGKGLGTRLLKHRLNHIAQKPDYHDIVVRTSQMAWQFYEKGGFILSVVVKDYWAPGYDLYYMTKKVG